MICRECPHYKRYDRLDGVGICTRWKLTKYDGELCQCDPCRHCQHFSEYEDRDTGWVEYGCNAEVEFPVSDNIKPCPYCKPVLASDGLLEQIAEWEEERFWREEMRIMEECE